MRISLTPRNRYTQAGGALLIALLSVVILGFTLSSYLIMVSNQNHSVMRSLAWNSCIPALEAGVEEALSHLYQSGLDDIDEDGWTASGGWYQRARRLPDGTAYLVRIQPVNPPIIVATGVAPSPIRGSTLGSTDYAIRAAALDSANYVSRSVRVTTKRDALFVKGMVAKGTIDLMGNNVASDSFDSSDPLYSTGGRYDPAKRKAQGDIATNSGLVNSLNVGNANVRGNVSTGPGGSVDIGPNGVVGDNAWFASGKKGIQPGHSSDDMNVQFPDVIAPFTTGTIPVNGSVGGTNYDLVMTGGNYAISSLGGQVYVSGDTTLYVSSSFNLTGKEFIYVAPGASLTLYVAAPSASIGGNGIVNPGGNALAFTYKGLPSNTSLSYSGNAAFSGTIYAPNADFTLGGGGSTTYDFVGASITKTVKMNGHFNFHYDELLAKVSVGRAFIPTSWNEMAPGYGL